MSWRRVDCCFCTTLKTAWVDLPGNLTQPGSTLSSFKAVRSASTPTRLSRSAPPILPISLIGIALAWLAVIQRGRLAIDPDVALDLISLIVGNDFHRVGFELLVHHHTIGGKSGQVGGNGIGRVGFCQFALDRQAQRDHGR